MPSAKTPSLDRRLRARQVYRFYEACKGEEKEDIKNRLKTADPGFRLLEALGWAEQHPDAEKDVWLDGWNNKGGIKTWIKNNLVHWRREWDKTGQNLDDGGAKAKQGQETSGGQHGGDEGSTADATVVPQVDDKEEGEELQTGGQGEGEQPSSSSSQLKDAPSSCPSAAAQPRHLGRSSLSPRMTSSKLHDLDIDILPGALPPLEMPTSSSRVVSNHRNDGRGASPASTNGERRHTLAIRNRATAGMPETRGDQPLPGRGATVGDGERLGAVGPSSMTEGRGESALTESPRKGMVTAQERQEWLDWYRKVFLPQERIKEK